MSIPPLMDDVRPNAKPSGERDGAAKAGPLAGIDLLAKRERPRGFDRADAAQPFLSLSLLLLVFFIVLVSISSRENLKSTKVMNSVASTFAPSSRSATVLADRPDVDGQEMAGQMFQKRIANLLSEHMRVAKVTVVTPGEEMRVSLPADSLFHPGTANVREFQDPLLDRVVAELSSRPPGLTFELEFEIGTPYAIGVGLPIGATLEIERAGAFARRMLALGAPPNAVSVALAPGDPRNVQFFFIVRGRDPIATFDVEPGP